MVGFIIEIYYDARSYTRQIYLHLFVWTINCTKRTVRT